MPNAVPGIGSKIGHEKNRPFSRPPLLACTVIESMHVTKITIPLQGSGPSNLKIVPLYPST
jgi:hypothetical protein